MVQVFGPDSQFTITLLILPAATERIVLSTFFIDSFPMSSTVISRWEPP